MDRLFPIRMYGPAVVRSGMGNEVGVAVGVRGSVRVNTLVSVGCFVPVAEGSVPEAGIVCERATADRLDCAV